MAGLGLPAAWCGRPRPGRAAVAITLHGTEELGGGATDLSEPIIRDPARRPARPRPAKSALPGRPMPFLSRRVVMANILVVDDDRDTAETMARWLKCFGHDVRIARDGYKAIDIARRVRPDYVLLDIGLPGLDGYEVASRLRREQAGPLVIIAVTGYCQEEDRRRALAAGCDHHFVKPIDHDALIALLSAANPQPHLPIHAGPPPGSRSREGRPMPKVSRQVEITNALGLHLRAAALFMRLAREFQADVQVGCDGRKASGQSIIDLISISAACGSRIELEADGPDAEAALDALTDLIGRRFDEQA